MDGFQLGASQQPPQGVPKPLHGSNSNLSASAEQAGLFKAQAAGAPPTGQAFGFRSGASSPPSSKARSPVPEPIAAKPTAQTNGTQQAPQQQLHGGRRNWQEQQQQSQLSNGHHMSGGNQQERRPRIYQPQGQQGQMQPQMNRRQPGQFGQQQHQQQQHNQGQNQFNQRNLPMFRRQPSGHPGMPSNNVMPGRPRHPQQLLPHHQPQHMQQQRGGPHHQQMRNGNFGANRGQPARKFDPALKTDYDFEKANQEFQELDSKLSKLTVNGGDKENEKAEEPEELQHAHHQQDLEEQDPAVGDKQDDEFYDKKKSFFDKISCEAIERSKGWVSQ